MNYALTRMAAGDIATALDYLERARVLNPAYFLLEINLGIAKSQVGRHPEAEGHFLRAISLEPNRYESNYYTAVGFISVAARKKRSLAGDCKTSER